MHKLLLWLLVLGFIAALSTISCKREISCEGCKANNKPPLANAGRDTVILLPVDSVFLDGSASSDPDGRISVWQWKKLSGPTSLTVVSPSTTKTTVKNLKAGMYRFELTVTDDGGLSAQDTVLVIVDSVAVANHPPVAHAGPDQTITLPKDSALLDGSASRDIDGTIVSYKWVKIAGPSPSNIFHPDSAKTVSTALATGVYKFELTVTDNGGLSAKDTVQVTVIAAPIACDNSSRPLVNAQLIPIGSVSETRNRMAVVSSGNKILFAGGSASTGPNTHSSRVDIYDIVSNSWSTAELSEGRSSGITAVASGSKVLFAGGEISDGTLPTDAVDIYDIPTNTWSTAKLSLAGEKIAAAAVGDKVLFAGGMGGFSGGEGRAGKADIYNLTTNSWSVASLIEYKVQGHAAVTANNKVYIAGGTTSWLGSVVSNTVEIYDDATSTWSSATMLEAKSGFAGIVAGNKIYWGGGVTNPAATQTCSVEIKDLSTGNSTTQYLFRPTTGSSGLVKDNKIVFFSERLNSADNTTDITKFDIYDIASNTWSVGVFPVTIRQAVFICVNNTVYVAGAVINGTLSDKVWRLEF